MTYVIVAFCIITGLGSVYIFKAPPDNPVEELSEEIIEMELDLPKGSVDLTPSLKIKEKEAPLT